MVDGGGGWWWWMVVVDGGRSKKKFSDFSQNFSDDESRNEGKTMKKSFSLR